MSKLSNRSGGEILVFILIAVVAILAAITLNAWLVMVLFGAVASIFGWTTISFFEAIVVSIALGFLGSFFKSNKS